ncbi:MAG TPA: transcriptional regulator [Methanotrichaceae archaeon]|nr:transcriptional regulator [Methanotrichaceae archaeon]
MEEMTSANIGYIMGSPQRERVLQILGSKGSLSSERIAKIEHIPAPGVKRILEEMSERQIVSQSAGAWTLTEMGKEVEREIKKRA